MSLPPFLTRLWSTWNGTEQNERPKEDSLDFNRFAPFIFCQLTYWPITYDQATTHLQCSILWDVLRYSAHAN